MHPAITSLPSHLVLAAISRYQRHISPYKGFRCAFRAHRGGLSCSAYGQQVIREHGLLQGLRLLRQRFRECAASAQSLRSSEAQGPTRQQDDSLPRECNCAADGCLLIAEASSCFF
ncbi:MAG: membrane protein insertion efficiency factor YidD [Planctomycetales bacterium]